MVSLKPVYLGFVGLHLVPNRPNTSTYTSNLKNNVKPVNLFNPLTKINEFFESELSSNNIPKDLPDKILFNIRSGDDIQFDSIAELSELTSEESKLSLIKLLLIKWNSNVLDLSLRKLMSFKRLVEHLRIPKVEIYPLIHEVYLGCSDRYSLDNLLILKHIFRPSDKSLLLTDNHRIYDQSNLNPYEVLSLAKGALINDEFLTILHREIHEKMLIDPPTYPKNKQEYDEFKEKLFKLSTYSLKFQDLPKFKLNQLSVSLHRHIWELDFYKNKKMPNDLDYAMDVLNVDPKFLKYVFDNLIDKQISDIVNITIPNIVNTKQEVHRYLAHQKSLEAQFNFTLSEFKNFKAHYNEVIRRLELKGYDLSQYDVDFRPFGIIGKRMPYLNLVLLSPENKKLATKEDEPETDDDEDEFPEPQMDEEAKRKDMAELKKELIKTEENLKICSHLSKEERTKFYFDKFPETLEAARRAKRRRDLLAKLRNPFGTRSDLDDVPPEDSEDEPPKPRPPTMSERLNSEPVDVKSILSDLKTEYMSYLMNLKHLEWHIRSSEYCPIETVLHLYEDGENITRPNARKLDFASPQFVETYKMLDRFKKKDRNPEADKHRDQLFYDSFDSAKKVVVEEISPIPANPNVRISDIPFLSKYLNTGGRFTARFNINTDFLVSPSESQKETTFYRIHTSQPAAIYTCSRCGYSICSGSILTEGSRIELPESQHFKIYDDHACCNCGAGKASFQGAWPTGDRGYQFPKYITPDKEPEPTDRFGFPLAKKTATPAEHEP